ncbi:MAG: DUF4258 domain-containing protein [Candidatus Thermoplasmatota archaeon]|nr:DUF4258 domain-containing protein [Candidatus Thermoplasmatota archaeon]
MVRTEPAIEHIKKFIEENNFIISNHARVRMFQRNISTDNIKEAIMNGKIIEKYPDDTPCPSALIQGSLKNIPYHIVVAECEDHVRIVTVYIPEKDR